MTDSLPILLAKQELRRRMMAQRVNRTPEDDAALRDALACELLSRDSQTVAGIWPLPGEPDLSPLWHILHQRGHTILMPETTPRGAALRFRPWHPGCPMRLGRFGTRHPDTLLAETVPDLLFVPLLAFDRDGYRLGYGGGYYDRTLAALPRARAIGYGFSMQQVEAVPRGPFDLPLDVIVTEGGRVLVER